MVYKKYFIRGGKKYGPYLYENKRVGDKVVTNYLGKVSVPSDLRHPSKDEKSRVNFFRFTLVIILGLVALLLILNLFFQFVPTGYLISSIEPKYIEGESLKGSITLNLNAGELIPKDALVYLTLGNQEFVFNLSEVIEEELISGSYYLKDTYISGEGEGYGLIGEKIIYPELDFDLRVFDSASSGSSSSDETEEQEEQSAENQESSEEASEETQEVSEEGNEEIVEESEEPITEEIPEQSPETSESSGESSSESSSESGSEESSSGDSGSSDSGSDSGASSDSSSESSSDSGPSESGAITGEAIAEGELIISGKVSKDSPFNYNLAENKDIEIVEGSVKYNGEGLTQDEIKLSKKDTIAEVTTEYSIIEKGFGEAFLSQDTKKLKILLENFNIIAENGSLELKIVYQENIIATAEQTIVTIPSVETETLVENLTQEELPLEDMLLENLTLENKSLILKQEFSQIRFKIGESYSLNLSEYFENADEYGFNVANISAIIEGEIITFSSENFRGLRAAQIIAYRENRQELLESNEFNIFVSSGKLNISKTRSDIKVGEKVKWVENISLEVPENIILELPISSENITIKKIDEETKEIIEVEVQEQTQETETSETLKETLAMSSGLITAEAVADIELDKEQKVFIHFLKNLFSFTGFVVETEEELQETISLNLQENVSNYIVEYYTEAPVANETETSYGKEVVISAPSELNYTEVLSFANIPEIYSTEQSDQIKLYWVENNSYVDFEAYDLDENGLLDYIEWITPHLSSQTFQIILITKAQHLDENKGFISDIYGFVKNLDGNWSEVIANGEYVRVTFELALDNTKDITVYARSFDNGSVSIEIYPVNQSGNETLPVAIIENITSENTYQTYLTNLSYSEDSFDLRVIGLSGIEFDYIVDPVPGTSQTNDSSEWSMFHRDLNHTGWDGVTYSTISGLNRVNYTTGGGLCDFPTVADGYVYVGSYDHKLYQLNASNVSQFIASYATEDYIDLSSPAVANGYVYFGSADDKLYQLNASNVSQFAASYTTGGQVLSSPAVANGYVYVGSSNFKIYQLNASNISQFAASYTTSSFISSSPAVADGYVYIGSSDDKLYQLNASNISQFAASYTAGGDVDSSPAVVNGYVYVGSNDHKLYQLNASNVSQFAASYTAGGDVRSSPAVVNGYVYVGSDDSNLYQLNASNISQFAASYTTASTIGSSPAVANGYVYVISYDGTILYQFNSSNVSDYIVQYVLGDMTSSSSSPSVANGYVYVGNSVGILFQLNASNISLNNVDPFSVNSCKEINVSGNYIQTTNLVPTGSIPTCINISFSNITFDCGGYSIINSSFGGYGIYAAATLSNITVKNCNITVGAKAVRFFNVNSSKIENSTFSSSLYGPELYASSFNTLSNLIVFNNSAGGVVLFQSYETLFFNLNSFDNFVYGNLYDGDSATSRTKMIFNNSYGQIFLFESFEGFTENPHNISFPGNINITNNSVFINVSVLQSFNSSANITLRGLPTNYVNPVIYRNGSTICNSTTIPSCWNFTNLNAGTVVFNVSSWSNYSIGEAPSAIDTTYPSFSRYGDNNASVVNSGTGFFNVGVVNTNGTVWLEINNTNVTATPGSTWIYQETPDSTAISNTTAWVNYNSVIDGNWGTWGNVPEFSGTTDWIEMTYNKPVNFEGNVIWRVADITNASGVNLTLPNDCIDAYSDKIVVRVFQNGGGSYTSYWVCYNGSWNADPGRQQTLRWFGSAPGMVYEEGMWFNTTAQTYNANYSFSSNGTYSYRWWAYGNGSSNLINNSGLRNYFVNSAPNCSDPNPSQSMNCSGQTISYTTNATFNKSINFSNSLITATNITIQSGGVVIFENVTLVVKNFIVERGGRAEFVNGKNTVWHNGDFNISGTTISNQETHRVNVSLNNEFSINVLGGGNWTILNATNITNGDNASAYYPFKVYGNISLVDSFVSGTNEDGVDIQAGAKVVGLGNVSFYNVTYAINTRENISLSGNISTTAGGILTSAHGLEIDGKGFALNGKGFENGIYLSPNMFPFNNIQIRNLTIDYFSSGIYATSGPSPANDFLFNLYVINNTAYGIALPGINHTLKEITIQGNGLGGLNIGDGSTSGNYTLININCFNNSANTISTGGVGYNMIYNNSYGQIKFTNETFLNSISSTSNFTFPGNIIISNNSVYINISAIRELNASANITFYNLGERGYSNPVIYREDSLVCNSTTTPACWNFTSLNATNVVFNVSSWSNYSIGEGPGVSLFAGGTGTLEDPYQIASWSHLNNTRTNLTAYYILTTHLDFSSPGYAGLGNNWVPIGNYSLNDHFVGNFNGNYSTISNLTIYLPSIDFVGLFGSVLGNISNLNLYDVNVTGNYSVGGLTGLQSVGAIVNSSTSGTVLGSNYYTGGLAGQLSGGATITNSSALVRVIGFDTTGGLVGRQVSGTITNSSSYGSVIGSAGSVGGLVGRQDGGTISNSFASGNVSSSGNSVGGLVGFQTGGTISSSAVRIFDSQTLQTSGTALGMIVGFNVGTITSTYPTTSNSQFGNITFLTWDVSMSGGGNLTLQIYLNNNSAYVNSSISGLNKSANITLYGLSTSYSNPVIFRDGSNVCNSTTTPSCWNFTSLNAGTVVFNVSSWSNYSIGEAPSTPQEPLSSDSSGDEWRMFMRGLNHTGWDGVAYSGLVGLNMTNYSAGGDIQSSPAVANGYVYVGSNDGNLYQLNASDVRQVIQTYNTTYSLGFSPALANGYVYITGGASFPYLIYQLNASNISQQISNYTFGFDIVYSSPIIANGYIYIGTDLKKLYQINATNLSQLIATYSTSESIYLAASPSASNYVYTCDSNGIVYQLNSSNVSQLIANYSTGGRIDSSPAIINNYLYVGSNDGNLYQLNARNVSQYISSYPTGGSIYSSPALANGYVYIGSDDNKLYQLNASNVSQFITSYTTSNDVRSSPALANGYVYIGSLDNNLYQLNASNVSQLIANYTTGDYISSSPAIANGYVYFGSRDNLIYQLNASNISLLNRPAIDEEYPIFSNFVDNNNTVYIGGRGLFNITLLNTNGTVWLRINNTNITATNLSAYIFNVSYNFEWNGTYTYVWYSYGNGSFANYNFSFARHYVVKDNNFPTSSNLILTSNTSTNYTNADLNCSAILIDNDLHSMNVSLIWYNNNTVNLTFVYNNSYSNGTSFSGTLKSRNLTIEDSWMCSLRVFDYLDISGWSNSSNLTIINAIPTFSGSIANQAWLKSTNKTNAFNLNDYFNDIDAGQILNYSYNNISNITLNISSGNVSFYPDYGFSGTRYLTFYANDSLQSQIGSNNITLNVYFCGDGVKNSGEQCDGSDFGGETCISRGFAGGSLNCNSCSISTTACTSSTDSGSGGSGICEPGACVAASSIGCGISYTNNCGSSCGVGTKCSNGGTCDVATGECNVCTDTCVGLGFECGTHSICGVNTYCGGCDSGKVCQDNGECVSQCLPNCNNKQCGSDGCGGTCGTCDNGFVCNSENNCLRGESPDPGEIPEEIIQLPLESQSDSAACTKDYSCGEWGECEANYELDSINSETIVAGVRRRTCFDLNKCYPDFEQIEECSSKEEVVVEKNVWCEDDYIEVKNNQGIILARIKKVEESKKTDIIFNLEKEEYCPYCFNGIQDYDETGVDCGGSCKFCSGEQGTSQMSQKSNYEFVKYAMISLSGIVILGAIILLIFSLITHKKEKLLHEDLIRLFKKHSPNV